MIKVLLLEDDKLFGSSLSEYLQECSYDITWVKTISQVLDITFEQSFDLYILDINLPDGDGKQLLSDLRRGSDTTPALFLTSYTDKDSLLEGFKSGCDDYLKKPVDLDELELRIDALLKRCNKIFDAVTFSNGVIFDIKSCRIIKDGKDLRFTTKALALLKLFVTNASEVLTKEVIEDELWKDEEFSEGSLRVYINRLKKILPQGCIVNLKGIGYRFELK